MDTKRINIIFPNQLFKQSKIIQNSYPTFLIEEDNFFEKYNYHKQKLLFHRASMKSYYKFLRKKGKEVIYIDSRSELSSIINFIENEICRGTKQIYFYNPLENSILNDINNFSDKINFIIYESLSFITPETDLVSFFRNDKLFFSHAIFYKQQRKRLDILMENNGSPTGGKFSFDSDNRKKYPKKKLPPELEYPKANSEWREAQIYVEKKYSNNFGKLINEPIYPINHKQANEWLNNFFKYRFQEFGPYEDAIVSTEFSLNHSLISPLLNSGLLQPREVLKKTLEYVKLHNIPLNSLEGFIRQIIGWREFIFGMYNIKDNQFRNTNFWKFKRKIPQSFYYANTGILPVDDSIKKINKLGYCHHIERLMVLGNFMLLCEFEPDDVYKWFMEVFIDSYDWVMVPNVYGMSQFSDGGLFATKPYISSSNYIKKMSDYKDGEWSRIWDSLYWNFIYNQKDFFSKNPRLSMMVNVLNRMERSKLKNHLNIAKEYLSSLDFDKKYHEK